MSKKTRLIIVIICAFLFLTITPYIILYSLGYRVDFINKKIVATGGFYIRVEPQGADIIIDSKINNKTGLFSNSIFVQDLLPQQHNILIKKDGYFDYQKNLLVKENEVTKLENVVLFKQKIIFDLLKNDIDYFYITPDEKNLLLVKVMLDGINFEFINLENQKINNFKLGIEDKKTILPNADAPFLDLKWSDDSNKALINIGGSYFLLQPFLQKPQTTILPFLSNKKEVSFDPQNSDQIFYIKDKNLYSNKQNLPIIKNIITYQVSNQNIVWLSYDGFLYNYDIINKTNEKINSQIFPIKKGGSYKIKNIFGKLLLQENQFLFFLNEGSEALEILYNPIKDLKISPDGKKILYFSNNEIMYSLLSDKQDKVLLIKIPDNINDCYWLNSDYLISESKARDGKSKITISEIDGRGNINSVDLLQTMTSSVGENIIVKTPKIYFNQRDKKLYILDQNNLLVSEKLIP